ncbi:hypothetical protein NEMBOFW57_010414 [Staphylotrichum longicolle]|uniref:GPI mannosyltransferase 1 n=1 Tax=Staphylotrichum longicolle TaxID=669026 RepID=A0AAD4EMR8_9PEZI|nr:hypothetical protein NEMBOFW57_010414 [Staphylotrichum longicolle]
MANQKPVGRPPSSQTTVTTPSSLTSFFNRPLPLYLSAAILRLVFLVYGLWQDANSPVKYTDIDYLVFTDAARFVSHGQSPYERETYRYTPILAWLLLPTAHTTGNQLLDTALFSSGKVLFAAADLVAGWLLERVLAKTMDAATARKYAAIWLLNPMVATISTRGSSEGLLGVLVMALFVHFKIYPFIYAPAIVWWMDRERMGDSRSGKGRSPTETSVIGRILRFITPARLQLAITSLATFLALNIAMFALSTSPPPRPPPPLHPDRVPRLPPQLALSCALIPLAMAKRDLPASMLAQTFAFVAFNKVCTSQYFLWYLILLPLYLPSSSFLRNPTLGFAALGMWVAAQGLWLQQGYQLEFLGVSAFLPGLWVASLGFFLVNCWILGVIIGDVNGNVGRGSK